MSAPVRITPRDNKFFEMFSAGASNLVTAIRLLGEFVESEDLGHRQGIAEQITDCEHLGDDLTDAIIKRLNTSFVVPFDHVDIYGLAFNLDDVVDLVDASSDHVVLCGLGELPTGIHKQVRILTELAALTDEAMPRLRKVTELEDYWITVKKIESDADRIHRRMLAKLFSGEYEALEVMKLKEVVDGLEEAVNAFERVAKTIEAIAVKES